MSLTTTPVTQIDYIGLMFKLMVPFMGFFIAILTLFWLIFSSVINSRITGLGLRLEPRIKELENKANQINKIKDKEYNSLPDINRSKQQLDNCKKEINDLNLKIEQVNSKLESLTNTINKLTGNIDKIDNSIKEPNKEQKLVNKIIREELKELRHYIIYKWPFGK
ncbi:MAG: hypothetical protein JSV33_10650 [bacterium]|nr:MAG: hypothetical protein JSV33_10650 [bacterium]